MWRKALQTIISVPVISDDDGWRRSILLSLPFACVAFALGIVLDPLSHQVTPFDQVAYPLMLVGLVGLEVVLFASRRVTGPVVLTIVSASGLFFLGKLGYLLFLVPASVNVPAEMTESFFWIPSLYVLSLLVPNVRGARVMPVLFVFAMLTMSLAYAIGLGNPRHFSVLNALVQFNLANLTLFSLTRALLGISQRSSKAEAQAETMHTLAHTDAVTTLPNRLGVQKALEATLVRSETEKRPTAVVYLDLDGFKVVNDTMGHDVGDTVLFEVARRWNDFCREGDCLGRWSGDEFVMTLWNTPGEEAIAVAERLISALASPLELGAQVIRLSASAGVSIFPDDGLDAHVLLRHADSALYTVKRAGKNGVRRFSATLDSEIEEQLQLERDLRLALERDEFELVYQPIVNLRDSQIIKLEALLRWRHPTRGYVSPANFIPVAESSGLIVPIGTWVLSEACRQAKIWNQPGQPRLKVAVNVASLQLRQANFKSIVTEALVTSGLPASLLELEITESVVLHDFEQTTRTLNELRDLGLSLSIDDFGTGYSSLSYLRDLPIQTIKVDRSFIRDLGSPRNAPHFALALIEAIMSIARALDLDVVAEGIETEAQAITLRGLGCNQGQGYHFARPEAPHLITSRLISSHEGAEKAFSSNLN